MLLSDKENLRMVVCFGIIASLLIGLMVFLSNLT